MKRITGFIVALAAVFAIVSCGDKDNPAGPSKVSLDKTSLTFNAEGGTETLNLTANIDWSLNDYPDEVKAWLTISPTSGKASDTPQTITVKAQPNKDADRNAVVKFFGNVLANQTLTVNQAGEKGDVESLTVAEFIQKGDTENAYRLTGQITNFKSGTNSSGKTYYQFDLVDASGKILVYSFTNIELWLDKGIQKNGNYVTLTGKYQFFADKSQHEVVQATIEKIENGEIVRPTDIQDVSVADFLKKSPSETIWYRLSGTVSGSINTDYGNFDVVQDGSSVYFYGADNVADFKDKLVKNAKITVVGHRADYSGKAEVTGGYIEKIEDPAPIETVTAKGVVYAVSGKSYIFKDEESGAFRYVYSDAGVSGVTVGDRIEVTGAAETYNQMPQIGGDPKTTVLASGQTVSYPEPVVLDAAALDAYVPTSEFKYVKITGDLTSSGSGSTKYYNLKVGDATRKGSLAYPTNADEFVGVTVDVTGFFVGISGTVYFNVLASDIKKSEHQTEVDELTHPITPGITWTLGAAAYDGTSSTKQTATVNKQEVTNLLKLGSSKAAGEATLSIPAGKTKIGFYAGGWKTTQTEEQAGTTMSTPVRLTIGDKVIDVRRNEGCTGNPKYTITFSNTADYYEVEVPSGNVKVTADARIVLIGITAY